MKNDLPFPELSDNEEKGLSFSKNITKSEIAQKASQALVLVDSGDADPIDMFIKTRALKEVCDTVLDSLKEKVEANLLRIDKSERRFFGVDLQMSEGSVKYSYDHDDNWLDIKEEIEVLNKKLKNYESLMRNAINNEIFDEHGVQVEPALISGGTSSVIKVVIPK